MAKKICTITGIGLFAGAALFGVLAFMGGSLLMTTYLMVAFSLGVTGAIVIATGFFIGNLGGDSKLLQTGMPGTAVVLSLQETGMVVNYTNQVLNIGLRVQVGNDSPYDISVRQMVPMIMLSRCTPGSTLGVKVDAHDKTKVAIDWSMVPGINMAGQGMVASPAPAPAPPGVTTPAPAPAPQPQYAAPQPAAPQYQQPTSF